MAHRTIEPLILGRVVGDVLNAFTPCVKLAVTYNGNRLVANGHELLLAAIKTKPRVDIGGDDMRESYTLIMVDPDAPSPSNPVMREHLHWMVTDIPGTTEASFGRELVSYESPRPFFGIHRYVFVLYRQQARQVIGRAPSERDYFSTKSFAEANGLGDPVAAVYFDAQRETAPRRR